MRWMKLCAGLIAGAMAVGLVAPAQAQDKFPKGPVKVIVPFPPGGPTDTVARLLAGKLQAMWGQTVLVDYKPGAGTIIGADFVAHAQPDGQTLGLVNSAFAVNPSLHKSMPYDTTKDLAPVTQLFNMQLAIVARPDAPFGNLKELIAYAKAHPGKLTYGTPGTGSTTHLGGELLKREAGIDLLHVAMKGSAPAHTELMAGRLDLVIDPLLSVLPYVQAGRMKMIATMGDKPVAGTNFPTVSQVIPGFNVGALLGFVAPAGTPRPVLAKIQADTARVLALPEMKQRAAEFGLEIVASRPEQFQAFIASEMKKWGNVVATANIHAD
jgi:tripartite-type tricarboxylate transporter receptor subunit TctC